MLSILPFDRVTRDSSSSSSHRESAIDRERPFKAYPRAPLPPHSAGGYYSPFAPPTFVGSVGIPAAHSGPHAHKRSSQAELVAMDLRGAPPPPTSHAGMYDTGSHAHAHSHSQHGALMDISHPRGLSSHGGGHAGGHVKSESEVGYPSLSPPTGGPQHHGGYSHHGMQHSGSMVPPLPSPGGPHSAGVSSTTINHSDAHSVGGSSSGGEGSPGEHRGNKVPPKKRPLSVPEDLKDNAYWEKRKKNNESAKRSREARRMKEEQIAMRVVYLEQENLQLRTEVGLLKSEIEKLRCMLYNS